MSLALEITREMNAQIALSLSEKYEAAIEKYAGSKEISYELIGTLAERGAEGVTIEKLEELIEDHKNLAIEEAKATIPKPELIFDNDNPFGQKPEKPPKKAEDPELTPATREGAEDILENKITDEKRQEIIDCGNAGYTIKETSAETHVAAAIVKMVYDKEGIIYQE